MNGQWRKKNEQEEKYFLDNLKLSTTLKREKKKTYMIDDVVP